MTRMRALQHGRQGTGVSTASALLARAHTPCTHLPASSVEPAGLTATREMPCLPPLSWRSSLPSAASHSQTCFAPLHEYSRAPSGENVTWFTGPECSAPACIKHRTSTECAHVSEWRLAASAQPVCSTHRAKLAGNLAAGEVPHHHIALLCAEGEGAKVLARRAAALALARRLRIRAARSGGSTRQVQAQRVATGRRQWRGSTGHARWQWLQPRQQTCS